MGDKEHIWWSAVLSIVNKNIIIIGMKYVFAHIKFER